MPTQNPYSFDPQLLKMMQQQRWMSVLGNIGKSLMQAGGAGAGTGAGLLGSLGSANQGQGGLLQMLQLQGVMDQRRQQQTDRETTTRRQKQWEDMFGAGGQAPQANLGLQDRALPPGGGNEGPITPPPNVGVGSAVQDLRNPTPTSGVYNPSSTRQQPGLLEGMSPQQMQILRALGREQGLPLLAKQAFRKPQERFETVQDPYGRGGVGQQSTTTGQITGYQQPKKEVSQYAGDLQFDEKVGKYYQIHPKTKKREYVSPLTGMEITTPEGLTIRTGVPRGGAGGMQKKTTGDIEKKLVGAREGLSRLRGIAAKFKPEYQEIPTRLGVAWTGLKARFGQGKINPEDRAMLTDFADYRRDSISNINLYIKDITGAQMSATETDRLRLAVPDPGEGIFGGDDPITFQAKLGSAVRDLEKAAVRYEHYLNQGITDPEEIARLSPLDSMRTAVNEQTGERLVEIDGQWVPLQ